jgi:hypothetical protein
MSEFLNLIDEYKMNEMEAKSWKVALTYLDLAQKYFPTYQHYQPGKKDPRKTTLFKYAYKLVREHEMPIDEYYHYISAQLQILKHITKGDEHPLVGPQVIAGDKAWNRWLVWKRKFNKAVPQETVVVADTKISEDLINSKKFLLTKFSELNKKCIIDSLQNRNLFRWVALRFVSPRYLAHSPIVKEWAETTKTNLLDAFSIDLSLYTPSIESMAAFKKEFSYEF